MSAASAPKATGEPVADSTDDDGWALLENLRRRLEDQAAQGRRTQQQVQQLAESIGALVEVQRKRSRWLNLNSFVAYLIFTMLCGAGSYLLYQSRAGTLSRAHDAAQRERDLAVRRADEAAARTAAREQADTRAWEVYQLLETGKRAEAETKLAALRDLPLSRTERAILAARAHETHVMAVDAALKAAAASFKAGRHADVIAPLEAALVSEPAGSRAVLMRYYLGVAYAKANALDKAVAHLEAAVDSDQEDARFQLASALDRSGFYARARAEYDRFATARPQSQLAVFAWRRSATLARMPAVAPSVAQPATPGATPPTAIAPGGAAPGGAPVAPAAPNRVAPGAAPIVPGAAPAWQKGVPPTGAMPAPAVPPRPVPAPGVAPRLPAPRPAVPAPQPGAQPPAPQPPAPQPPAPAEPPPASPAQPDPGAAL